MKPRELQAFIAKAIIAKRAREEAKTRYKNKKSLESDTDAFKTDLALGKDSVVPSFFCDDKPVIFCENEMVSNRLVISAEDVNRILHSFKNFKEAIENIEHGDLETMPGLMDIE